MRYGKSFEKPCYYMSNGNGSIQLLEVSEGEKDDEIFSEDLKWSNHVNMAVNKANRMLGIIKKTFQYLDCQSFLLLYQSLVRPHLDYAVSV